MPRPSYYVLSVICSVVLSMLVWRSPPEPLTLLFQEQESPGRYPASYFTQSHTTQFAETGLIAYTLSASSIAFYEHEAIEGVSSLFFSASSSILAPAEVILENPVLTFFDESHERQTTGRWVATSHYAEGNKGLDRVLMTGEVRLDELGNHQRSVTTSALLIKPSQQYAESDQRVTIMDQSGITTAIGMRLYFDESKLELLSRVKSQLNPVLSSSSNSGNTR